MYKLWILEGDFCGWGFWIVLSWDFDFFSIQIFLSSWVILISELREWDLEFCKHLLETADPIVGFWQVGISDCLRGGRYFFLIT